MNTLETKSMSAVSAYKSDACTKRAGKGIRDDDAHMEHVPIWLHEFTKKNGVIGDRCNVYGMGSRVSRPEIIRGSNHRAPF